LGNLRQKLVDGHTKHSNAQLKTSPSPTVSRTCGSTLKADKAAGANEEEYLAKTLSQNLLSTLKDALERFPEDTWFAEMRDDAWKHFGAEQAV